MTTVFETTIYRDGKELSKSIYKTLTKAKKEVIPTLEANLKPSDGDYRELGLSGKVQNGLEHRQYAFKANSGTVFKMMIQETGARA